MAEITASMVKDLREKTGAGMMDCKKALSENGGDFGKAEEWLRKKGISKAASKGARVAAEGLLGFHCTAELGVMVEVNSETDFVARNPDFVALTAEVVEHVAKQNPADVAALLEQGWVKDPSKKVKDVLTEKVARIGENITVRRLARYAGTPKSIIGGYLHSNSRVGVLVELDGATEAVARHPEVAGLAKELAMQIAALSPQYVSREFVPAAVTDKEKENYRDELRLQRKIIIKDGPAQSGVLRSQDDEKLMLEVSGKLVKIPASQVVEVKVISKPENMWDKILAGKLDKYFEGVCLVDQLWVKDDKRKIHEVIAEAAGKAGGAITVKRFTRFEVGEGIEKKKDDLAAEVAKIAG